MAPIAVAMGGSGIPVLGEKKILSHFFDESSSVVQEDVAGVALKIVDKSESDEIPSLEDLARDAAHVWDELVRRSASIKIREILLGFPPPSATSPSILQSQTPLISIVVGVRPNLMKAAPIIAAFARLRPDWKIELVHTGQHSDKAMSDVFFDELGIKKPDR